MSSYARPLVIPSTANGGLIIGRSALFYLIASASENLIIAGFKGSSQVIDVQGMGAGWGDWITGGFDRLVITTASGNAGTLTIAIGDDYAEYTTLTSVVSVQDTSSGIYNALNGFSFQGQFAQVAPGGVLVSFFKLRNPAGSGVNLYVKRARCYSASGITNFMYQFNNDVTDHAAGSIGSKLVGSGLVAKAKLSCGGNAAGGDGVMAVFGEETLVAGVQGNNDLSDKEIIIQPGNALYGSGGSNADLKGTLEWLEK